jgi:hypothetical protein
VTDKELWACASTVLLQYGDQAPAFVAARIGALVLVEDDRGALTWSAIAERLDTLMRLEGPLQ